MSEPLRLVFMGSDSIALPLLDWLAGEGSGIATLAAIVTGPDKAAGRGQAVRPNPVRAWAAGRGPAILQPDRLDDGVLAEIGAFRPDVSLVVAFGHILRDPFIALPRLGTLNLHASLLPRFRGASPIQSAIASGETETGMTLMRIIRALDAGPVADAEKVAISPLDTSLEVEARLAAAAVPLVRRLLPRLQRGELAFVAQSTESATYCRRLEKADGVLDFSAAAPVLAARVNGLFPWPGAVIDVAGSAVRLGLADAIEGDAGRPGTVVGADASGLLVAAGRGTLRLRRMQRPGGRMLEAPEFLRGFPIPAGTVLASGAMPALVADAPFKR